MAQLNNCSNVSKHGKFFKYGLGAEYAQEILVYIRIMLGCSKQFFMKTKLCDFKRTASGCAIFVRLRTVRMHVLIRETAKYGNLWKKETEIKRRGRRIFHYERIHNS
jgi:hypothetical protein